MGTIRQRLDPRYSPSSALLSFSGGLGIHVLDQALHFRAGPVPILVTAPLVAVLTYLHLRPETGKRRMAIFVGWGFVGTGLALLGFVLHALSFELPRAMTEPELIVYDLGLFLWFVLSLTVAYSLAARANGRDRREVAAILSGPVLQLGGILLLSLLLEWWLST